jgi:hypothetical protein
VINLERAETSAPIVIEDEKDFSSVHSVDLSKEKMSSLGPFSLSLVDFVEDIESS